MCEGLVAKAAIEISILFFLVTINVLMVQRTELESALNEAYIEDHKEPYSAKSDHTHEIFF